MSKSKKQASHVESDSDWDSLPGDVPEPGSSPEPANSPTPRGPAYSPLPTPPKQPYAKHHTSAKPTNMYKNSSNPVKHSGNATTFEDRSGGIWNEDDRNDDIKVTFSKEDNNNSTKNNEIVKGKQDTGRTKKTEAVQDRNKKPPFTDFREALSSPMPATQNLKEQHEMVGVNKAYRIESGDEIHTSHDSWDDSETESPIHTSIKGRELPMVTNTTKRAMVVDTSSGVEPTKVTKVTKLHGRMEQADRVEAMKMPYQHHLSMNQNFENCCMIQVSEGAFDDRYRPSFFHGNKNHFHIKEDNPRATITDIADKAEVALQRFWREVFGVLQIFINFFIIFILELFKTIIFSIRYLVMGILYTTGDHFIKPLLSAMFNNFIQPVFVLLLNIFTILGNALRPILALTRELLNQVSIPLHAFRLFVWDNRGHYDSTYRGMRVV